MKWYLKCAAFHALNSVPGGGRLYRLAQRHVTRNHLFRVTDAYLRTHQYHVEQYRRVHPGRVLEFGGGRHFLFYYSDSSLSPVNFYRFSEFQWKFLNPSNHFQNRSRHGDYERLFDEPGLLPIEIKTGESPFSSLEAAPLSMGPQPLLEAPERETIAICPRVLDWTRHDHIAVPQ